jgi:uncharacterized protein (TIGR02246 family)
MGSARRLAFPGVFLVAVVGVAAACRPGSPRADTSRAAEEVRAASRAVAEAEANKDAAAVMPYWTEDAVVHFSGEAPIHGKDAIGKMYAERLPRLATFRAETNSVEVAPGGDLAWEAGTTFVTLPGADPAAPPSTSKFLIVWRKEADGQWRIAACALTANPKPA